MLREDMRARPRRRWLGPVTVLVVSAIAVMAASQPTPAADDWHVESIASPAHPVATEVLESPGRPLEDRRLPWSIPRGPTRPGRPESDLPQPAPGSVARPVAGSTVAFLGNSYSSGWNGAGLGPHGWPGLIGKARGWRTINLAVAGTGFIEPGLDGPADQLASACGGQEASGRRIHRRRPQRLALVLDRRGQSGRQGHRPAACCVAGRPPGDRRAHLAEREPAAAVPRPARPPSPQPPRSVDAIFIDPLADGWFSGSRHRLIGSDGIHPTAAGHRYMAERVLAASPRRR